jgi:hypothetical protein
MCKQYLLLFNKDDHLTTMFGLIHQSLGKSNDHMFLEPHQKPKWFHMLVWKTQHHQIPIHQLGNYLLHNYISYNKSNQCCTYSHLSNVVSSYYTLHVHDPNMYPGYYNNTKGYYPLIPRSVVGHVLGYNFPRLKQLVILPTRTSHIGYQVIAHVQSIME